MESVIWKGKNVYKETSQEWIEMMIFKSGWHQQKWRKVDEFELCFAVYRQYLLIDWLSGLMKRRIMTTPGFGP